MKVDGRARGADREEHGDRLVVGQIVGLFGIKGWVKVFSHTQPRDNIVQYSPWQIKQGGAWRTVVLEQGQAHGKGVVAKLKGCDDRDTAALLVGAEIAIDRAQLGRLHRGEYYWADLIGLRVVTEEGQDFGVVDHLFETGANDVLVVRGDRERLIPYITGQVVKSVDLDAGEIRVDWDPDF